jgi:hypothetical protein
LAANALASIGDRSAVPALIERVGDDAWQTINGADVDKDAALEALRKLGPDLFCFRWNGKDGPLE